MGALGLNFLFAFTKAKITFSQKLLTPIFLIIGIILEHAIANIAATNAYEAADNIANQKFIAATFWINIIFSWLDVKQLKKAGHDTSKFKSWLLLVPVYIYLRCEETKVNLAPFIIWIVLFIITFL